MNRAQVDAFRQDITLSTDVRGVPLNLHSTWGLFSPRELDDGSRLLLEHIEVHPQDDCLDLGCGYGPIGLTLARLAPQGQTLMVDKDFVAVDYAARNARLNRIDNAQALLSNGFSAVGNRQFDLIVSNIPAKVGKEMLYIFLYDALDRLKPGGRLYFVSINGLREFFKRTMNEVFGNYEKVKQGKDYTVSLARR
ncbi:MAG: methyltransferase [Halothiobacillaceae bacterium]|nr:methyltransferase [Halothiobacillaceae bacterium]